MDAQRIKNENEFTVREAELKRKYDIIMKNNEKEYEKRTDELNEKLKRKQQDVCNLFIFNLTIFIHSLLKENLLNVGSC